MYRALDVARYIINYMNDRKRSVTNLKLQKILYYVQAAFLVEKSDHLPCFAERIIAWQHGPVVCEVYNEFKKYGARDIPSQDTVNRVVYRNGRLMIVRKDFSDAFLADCDRELINDVVDGLMEYDAWTLVDHTHEEDPWQQVPSCNEEITTESMRAYFEDAANRRRIYGYFD